MLITGLSLALLYAGRQGGIKPFVSRASTGYVRLGSKWGFQLDDGTTYWPMGHNLGWQGSNMPDLPDCIRQMKGYGANWARIWACSFDGKNPWWHPSTNELPEGSMNPTSIKRWDDIISAAEDSGVKVQFVLFHHGEFSSNVNPNWPDNPWNVARGGWLQKPDDFFTDPRAKSDAKEWIKFAVKRWGKSPAIMAWELFNEVEWCDASRNNPASVDQWHQEMATYIRSIDTYHHLITTSSNLEAAKRIRSSIDFYQPHGYPASVGQMVAGFEPPQDLPTFFGEVGPGSNGEGDERAARTAIRDGIYEALFHHHAGSAQYWYWDKVYSLHLENEWRIASSTINAVRPFARPAWKPSKIKVLAEPSGAMILAPGGGWEPFKKYDYDLPTDSGTLGGFSSFFQGKGHSEMRTQPVTLRFNAAKAGKLTIRVDEVSGTGANLVLKLNGEAALERGYRGADQSQAGVVSIDIPQGKNVVTIDNNGPDWIRISAISVPGIGLPVMADGAGDGEVELVRAKRTDTTSSPYRLGGLTLKDGRYRIKITDLESGASTFTVGTVAAGACHEAFVHKEPDVTLLFTRQGRA